MVMQRIHPDDRKARQRFVDMAPELRKNYEAEYRLLFPDGRIKHLHVLAHATRNLSGHVEVVGTFMDVTAAKRAEEVLRRAQGDLAHVSRINIMGELTASIAHEVNQPLTAVMNNANACLSLLANGSADFREIQETLGEIVDDAGRASAVIARVRQLARKAPFERSPQDLREVITDVVALTRLETAARRVRVVTELPEELPLVSGDRVQLQQVLLNLIVNGMDAMNTIDESNRVLVISARPESREGRPEVVVSVQDAGIGFKAGEKDRLFEAFYTTKPHGTGMGLAISRSIIEAHGGRLWALANPGPGSTFLFSVPAGEATRP
jgi:C4-dicarboxylate-specific signal transduction histidine kinase